MATKSTLTELREEVISHVSKALERDIEEKEVLLSYPPDITLGSIAFGCFSIAKNEDKAPAELSSKLAEKINGNIEKKELIENAESAGPYINFKTKNIAKNVIEEIEKKKEKYGKSEKKGKTILFEFSQPNTHKSFHVGHVRGTVLGQAMVNAFNANGYDIIPINYSGDVGAHIEKILWMMEKNHDGETAPKNKTEYLGSIYTEAEKALEKNPDLKKEVEDIRKRIEEGDKKLLKLWKTTRKWSIDELNEIYKELGVTFKRWYFESEFEKTGKKIVQKLLDEGIAKVSEGATIVDLSKYNLDVFLILRSDGSPLYSTKELALAEEKIKDFNFDEALVQTDVRQKLYFQQFFKTLELMGIDTPMTNQTYDFVDLPTGAMSSRRGNVITYDSLRDELIESTKKETEKRHSDWKEDKINSVASALALATLKFEMLKVDTQKKITFDTKRALSFEGFTASYILYTAARINSILKKGKVKKGKSELHTLDTDEEKSIIHSLLRYPEVTEEVVKEYNPAKLANYLFDLTKLYSHFYHSHKILEAESESLVQARLLLSTQVKSVIESGLSLLGIEAVEEM